MLLETAREEQPYIWDSPLAVLGAFPQIHSRNHRVVLMRPYCANDRFSSRSCSVSEIVSSTATYLAIKATPFAERKGVSSWAKIYQTVSLTEIPWPISKYDEKPGLSRLCNKTTDSTYQGYYVTSVLP